MTVTIKKTITTNTDAYASGDCIGGKIEINAPRLSEPAGKVLHGVVLTDTDKQNAAMDILFFREDPSLTSFTNNSVLNILDDDLSKLGAAVSVTADDYVSLASNSAAVVSAIGEPFDLDKDTSTLYAAIKCGGTPTYASTSSLNLIMKFI